MKSIDSRALRMPRNGSTISARFVWIFIVLGMLILSSCEKEINYGHDGRHGNAYLSLNWIDSRPLYLETGTYDIPRVFEWGRYYRTYPGIYTLYYEGEIWNGHNYVFYAWEMDYEIWINPGEPGGYGYDGRDGRDTYFSLELSPFGPYIYYDDAYKNTSGNEIIIGSSETDDFTIIKKSTDYTLKIKFTKVEKRSDREHKEVNNVLNPAILTK